MTAAIKVVADSVCDVPRDLATHLGITLIPTVVTIGNQSYLDDDIQLTRDEFYRRLPTLNPLPTTSACPLGLTRDMVAAAAAEARHLILIAAPAHLSSIYNNFRLAAEEFAPGRYTLIDSGQLTMGAGFLVLEAAEAAAAGASVEDIVARLQALQSRIHIYAALNTLDNLLKSGRVGWATAMAGRILGIKPVLSLRQGVVESLANIRTFRRATDYLIDLAMQHTPLERLAILHTDHLAAANELKSVFAPVFPLDQILVVNVNPSLGTHVGAKGLGVALITRS